MTKKLVLWLCGMKMDKRWWRGITLTANELVICLCGMKMDRKKLKKRKKEKPYLTNNLMNTKSHVIVGMLMVKA